MMKNFRLAIFQFILSPREGWELPNYLGATLRGGFGYAFKKTCCPLRNECRERCSFPERCVYSYIFETPPPKDAEVMRKYPFAPHPFILDPPLEKNRGGPLTFGLTLIGKSIDYLPYFLYTFEELGRMGLGRRRSKFSLQEVRNGDGEVIYEGREKVLTRDYKALTIEEILERRWGNGEEMEIHFLTPTRLRYEGRLTSDLEFHILLRNLLRRISLLSYFHCREEVEFDFKGLIEESKGVALKKCDLRWVDWERYSNRQKERMKMGGFIGRVRFRGNFEVFLPYLLLGEWVHVGKGTSFGLGKYRLKGD